MLEKFGSNKGDSLFYKLSLKVSTAVLAAGLAVVLSGCQSAEQESDGTGAGMPSSQANLDQDFIDNIMPDFYGFTALQVEDSLDAIGLREMNVWWMFGIDPRDDDWEEQAALWFVCEQRGTAGEELEPGKLWLGWGSNCEDYKVVPDFMGLSARNVFDLREARGLNVSGTESGEGYTVCDQSVAAGTVLASEASGDSVEKVKLQMHKDCAIYDRVMGEIADEKQQKEDAAAKRDEEARILSDPNTFEGGRRFINQHSERFENDLLMMGEVERWLNAGAPIDGWLDAIFGGLPYMPNVASDMWDEAPSAYQVRWDELREKLNDADGAYGEAYDLFVDDIFAPSEVAPYIADIRNLTREALRLVKGMPYPQQ
jgi:hypothetical protein